MFAVATSYDYFGNIMDWDLRNVCKIQTEIDCYKLLLYNVQLVIEILVSNVSIY